MPEVTLGSVPFNEAIDHFRSKLDLPTQYYDDIIGQVHAKAFTVAGAAKASLISDIRSSVDEAIDNGTTITDFRKSFDETVAKHGWSYRGKRGWRTRVIYDNNLRTSRMAGRWEQFQRTKKTRPYLQYLTAGDQRVRPEHASWGNVVLPVDDSFWNTHFPPNGWGCRCTARTLSQRQLERSGLTVDKAPKRVTEEKINSRTGEVYGQGHKGIDTGWDYNVGKASIGPDIALGETIMAMPTTLRNTALASTASLVPRLTKTFAPWANSLQTRKQALGEIRTVGYMNSKLINALEERAFTPTTAVITITDKDVMHMLRQAKDGKHLALNMVRDLPTELATSKAVLYDKRDPAVLYVFDSEDSRKAKVVIRVNYRSKGRAADGERHSIQTNAVRTSGLVGLNDLKDKKVYEIIEGKL